MCNHNASRVVIEDLNIIDLTKREELMIQYLTETNSTIGVGVFVTERLRFYSDGERRFTTYLAGLPSTCLARGHGWHRKPVL